VDATAEPMIRLERVRKQYDDGTVAVEELSLDVGVGEVAVLVGPSGCGKTTTMRMVNRLVEPTSGRVLVEGRDVMQVDAVRLRRGIGYVIQQVGLFPHQTVLENVATVPRLIGWDRRRRRERADELLTLVGLDPAVHARRYPHQLSGGQRQRVGVARALAGDPPVLLMDEPFGAVDPVARDRLQAEFRRLQQQLRKTVVFVTHDVDEAIRIGDKVAVMREGGRLEQYADPATVLSEPATEFVADFVGADRTLRRLSVLHLPRESLVDWPTAASDASPDGLVTAMDAAEADWLLADASGGEFSWWHRVDGASPTQTAAASIAEDATIEEALASCLAHDGPGVVVVGAHGQRLGVATPGRLVEAARR